MAIEFRKCEACGRSNRLTRKFCFSCGANLSKGIVPPEKSEESGASPESSLSEQNAGQRSVEAVTDTGNDRRQLLGTVGSIILIIAVFTPAISGPVVGSVNFFNIWKVTTTIVIALGIASLILTLTRKYNGLWFTGLGSFAVLAVGLIRLQLRLSQARSEMDRELADNPFKGLADLAMHSFQPDWGWAFLFLGTGLIIVAAAINGGVRRFLENRVMVLITVIIIAIVVYLVLLIMMAVGSLSTVWVNLFYWILGVGLTIAMMTDVGVDILRRVKLPKGK